MTTRIVDRILEEWRELERAYAEATDRDVKDGLEARIVQVRRQYQGAVGQPPEEPDVRDEVGLAL